MNRRPRVYLDTSVWNFQYAEDALDKEAITRRFFEQARRGDFDLYSSDIVVQELNEAPELRRSQLLSFYNQFDPTMLEVTDQAVALSQQYMRAGVIPENHEADALHVAIASVHDIDIVLSWNMKHMVKWKTRRDVNGINLLAGYDGIEIMTPEGLINDNE